MSLFGTLMNKIFHHSGASAAAPPASGATATASSATASRVPPGAAATPTAAGSTVATAAPGATSSQGGAANAASAANVDVEAVLNDLAKKNGQELNWRTSIVDLMKLVGMDSSLDARKQLAHELGYTGDTNDSAAMNIWLHKQVMKKLADNGGKVPQDMLH